MSVDPQRVRVMVADDDADVRGAVADLIATEPAFDLVGQAADAEEAVAMATRLRPDVALLDVRMPGGGGPRATRAIRDTCPRTQVVALSAHDDREAVLEMIRAGAVGFLVKGLPGEELLTAIHRSARGETSLSARVADAVVGELASRLEGQERDDQYRRQQQERVRRLLLDEVVRMVFQPIADLSTGEVVGFEALARFAVEPQQTPDVWFAEAHDVGLGTPLELAALRAAVKHFDHLPRRAYLSVNVSPKTALSPHLAEAVERADPRRLMIEITEHAAVADYDALADALKPLRDRGVRLAIDDAGAGFASLRHILRLAPDVIKLDRTLCADIDTDPARNALATALIAFAGQIGSSVVAEGIERPEELVTLRLLGVPYGQGYFLARPAQLPVDPFEIATFLPVPAA